ncbi:hypothetical protein VE01_05624 [Pseudogymnoascus verrucosus]|uniref:Velvet domain-containing protein n=1 Tax=Pseudogymnoascus verrucosus TaxID=342668 RepID=A0A1B8GKJ9_9PEZI|nr:uncharacterized protein VE01_05624 [Pseudogymnoascus verrucosus]OBT96375.1 hypothetical protein VE01_05624 [Pseudogymnoascus verrucosus]
MSQLPLSQQFAPAGASHGRVISNADHELIVRQKPLNAKVFIGKEKDRKPIDPPPIVQLKISEAVDPSQNFLQSPYYFISTSLVDDDENKSPEDREEVKNALAGTLVSSLHRLKDSDNIDRGFFVFGDLSVKIEGTFKLQFTLYEVRDKEVEYITSTLSEPFKVHPAKNWPGMAESTFLTRSFSDQGVRLRLRKEPRFRLSTRGPGSDNYEPRHYNTSRRRQSKQMEAANAQEGAQLPITPITPQSQVAIGASRTAKIEPPDTTGLGSLSSQGGMYPMDNRKRGFSQTSQASLYGGPADESAAKRARQEMDEAAQLPFTGQPQFAGGQGMGYGGQQFSDPFQVQQPLMYQQNPQQPMQTFDQFSPTYMAPSPQQRINRGDQQQQGYFSPRRGNVEPFQAPSPYQSPTSRLPQTTQFQRSPAQNAFQYNQPMQPPPMQAPYGMQPPPQQQQYAPQPDLLMQPMPPNRSPGGLGMYQQPGPELDPLLGAPPKGGDILAGQGGMQPPGMFYGGRQQGPGMQQVRTSQQMGPSGQQMGTGGQQMGPGGQQGIPGQHQMGSDGQNMGTGLDLGER